MVRKLITSLCLTVAMGLGSVSWAADFQKGFEAYESGDYSTALKEWTPLAEQGNVFAQYILGVMREQGEGVPQDYKTARKWFTLAAEQGLAEAQTNLGMMYRIREGVPHDYQTAARWWTLAAEQGHAVASPIWV